MNFDKEKNGAENGNDRCIDMKYNGFQITIISNMRMRHHSVLVLILLFWTITGSAQRWTISDPTQIEVRGNKDIVPQKFVVYNTDDAAIKEKLWTSPKEVILPLSSSPTLLTVGLADGTADIFRMVQYEMMEEELSSSYPEIRTFRGQSISNPERTIRADWTENGFRAVIRDPDGAMYIDPYQRNDLSHRVVYHAKDIQQTGEWICGFEGTSVEGNDHDQQRMVGDCMFRSYRLAQATTAEYSNYFGATSSAQSALVMSQVVTAINRVNDVYEADVAVRLILIGNTDLLFYYNAASDPYNNGNGSQMLGQNQTNIDNVIGTANYDIGHVFSTGGGGVAYLQSVCNNNNKAGGVTGQTNPVGDPFYIDYVAHEMGHQFGGNHTQNNSCNRNSSTAMEPGSASTIMGYAGICAPNVQNNSDAYFHGISLQEIANHVIATNCDALISNGNSAPVVANVPNYTIPISTPFVLTASATDPDNDPLTYCWEQWDQEVGTMPPASTNTLGPMFRSLLPTASPSRYFYNLPDLVNNVNPTWEELPSVGRTMEFRVSVRDLYDGIYGCTDEDNTIITTNAGAGPFVVTSQNSGATWQENTSQTITWNVANTTASPINCANVDIFLSYDGGLTYPTTLLLNEPNDGSASVPVPLGTTTTGRFMVKGANNIFFDINNANIVIEQNSPNFTIVLDPASVSECNDGSVQTNVIVGQILGFTNPVVLSTLNLPPGAIASFNPAVVIPGNNSTLTISNLGSLTGTFTPTVRGTSTTGNKDATFTIELFLSAPASPSLLSPTNNATGALLNLVLDWSVTGSTTLYEFHVSTDNMFSFLVVNGTTGNDQYQVNSGLSIGTLYYWRVRSQNPCGPGSWSTTFSFTTGSCFSMMSTDVPVDIPSSGTPTVTSTLSVPISLYINDLNIIGLVGTHTYVDDLKFTLIAPNATEVLFWNRPCNNHDNFNINFDDEAPGGTWPCPPTNGLTYRPSNSLTPFDGLTSDGVWMMEIQDIANNDGGSLNSWGLKVCGTSTCQLVVNQTSGSGPGSLPAALSCAINGDSVKLSATLAGQTINIGNSPLQINSNVIIVAQAANITITTSGIRVFEIPNSKTVQLKGMIIQAGTSLAGGAISNSGLLILRDATIIKHPSVSGATLIQNATGSQLFLTGNCFINQ